MGKRQKPFVQCTGRQVAGLFPEPVARKCVLRKRIASQRGCAENDHFDLLVAFGNDLPGAVTVRF